VDTRKRLMHWPQQVIRLVVKYQQNPLRAARALAYAQVALHDGWLLAAGIGATLAQCEYVAHRTAAYVLQQLYPNETPGQFLAQLTMLTPGLDATLPSELSRASDIAVEALIRRTLTDGAGRVWPLKSRPAAFEGSWQPAPPLHAVNPTEGMAPNWLPWVMRSSTRYDPPVAPRPGSQRYEQDLREVVVVSQSLTETQREAAEYWNLDAGSVTPGGIWMKVAMDCVVANANEQHTRPAAVFQDTMLPMTMTAVALYEAFVDCWRVKLRDWSERPVTAVRRKLNPEFMPILTTPGFPAYVSGHATVSGAASTVLSHFWPREASRFAAMAHEAAMSRLWGGIHFRSDNDEGTKLGQSVARDVLSTLGTDLLQAG
jgi:hypothetical protein